ncbi:MAG: NAD-dependent deacylase, partial [Winogradskyella sp.]|nr:NAD-dependent deacylase [Winogradskyella sp.]
LGDTCKLGHQLRPHIVWFGEDVPMIKTAIEICQTADHLMIVGTSMQVYPAAGLLHYIRSKTPVYFIDPKPAISQTVNVKVIAEPATTGVKKAISMLR